VSGRSLAIDGDRAATSFTPASGRLPRQLRRLRESVGLSRARLGELAGVSAYTIKAYETGSRTPSRLLLTALLDALQAESAQRNEILAAAGFAPGGPGPGARSPTPEHTLEEAIAEIASSPWPAHLNNEYMDVVFANELAQRLWRSDHERDFPEISDRNLLAALSDPRFADRIANWDEAITLAVSILKGTWDEERLAEHPYFQRVVQRFMEGDTGYVQRFLRIWGATEPGQYKWRFWYPIIWVDEEVGEMRFRVSVNPASHGDSLSFNDWIPLDALTWSRLAQLPPLRR
jgi:transcriptional regulator with XRE-family HTH domain